MNDERNDTNAGRLSVIDALREQIHTTPRPDQPNHWIGQSGRRQPRVLAGVSACVAAAATVVAVVISAGAASPSPAYALTRHADGTVTITLRDEKDRAALNSKLAAEGIPVRVVPVVHGCVAPVRIIGPNHEPAPTARTLEAAPVPGPVGGYIESLTLYPPIDPGRTAVVAEADSGHIIEGQTVEGPAPACVGDTPPQTIPATNEAPTQSP